jgi:hypothetical protein
MRDICGIIPCRQPIRFMGAVTCDDQLHIKWHKQWLNHFKQLSYLGVRRVIRRQNAAAEENICSVNDANANSPPTLQAHLLMLQDTLGHKVMHTFCAGTTYCIQTIQWACRAPIGWGKWSPSCKILPLVPGCSHKN